MMKICTRTGIAAVLALSGLLATQTQAAMLLDDWTIDFTTVGGPVVNDIDAMGFNDAPVNATFVDDGNGVFNVGDMYRVQGKGSISALANDVTGNVTPAGLGTNGNFELTFVFDLYVKVDQIFSPTSFSWTHMAGNDVLSLYIQDLSAATQAAPGTGVGYDDGTLVAMFSVLYGDGGSVNTAGTLNGSDDATFLLTSLVETGILLDGDGNDLVVGPGIGATLALTDSNFDLDSNNNNILDYTGGGYGCTAGNQGPLFFCGQEDGTIRLAVPEPATIALIGFGLVGVGFRARKQKS